MGRETTKHADQILLPLDDGPKEYIRAPFRREYKGDARHLSFLKNQKIDVVLTSPPYWRKRDYGFADQIGQEATPEGYVSVIIGAMEEWRKFLRPTGSIFINIGDTYWRKSLAGIPSLIETHARQADWIIRNRIIWVKRGGIPDPAQNRLTGRYEYILHFALGAYYYDLFGYAEKYSLKNTGANPGDVWEIPHRRNVSNHLAPYPPEIVERVLRLSCPRAICVKCKSPRRRIVERTTDLDTRRPQANRALQIAREKGLTPEHIAAIQATGISDAGKARLIQNGTDRNREAVKKLAKEAKEALGGYFREFTFAKRRSSGWTVCDCASEFEPGVVLDPFMGTGTTLDVAYGLGFSSIGVDLDEGSMNGKGN